MINFDLRSLLLSALALGMSGCGLIDSDVTNFDLTLPAKSFTIDATSWQVDQTAATALLSTNCSAAPAALHDGRRGRVPDGVHRHLRRDLAHVRAEHGSQHVPADRIWWPRSRSSSRSTTSP